MIREVWRLLVGRRCDLCGERYRGTPSRHWWQAHAPGVDLGLDSAALAIGRQRAAARDRARRLDAATANTRRMLAQVDECRRRHTGPPCPGPCAHPPRREAGPDTWQTFGSDR